MFVNTVFPKQHKSAIRGAMKGSCTPSVARVAEYPPAPSIPKPSQQLRLHFDKDTCYITGKAWWGRGGVLCVWVCVLFVLELGGWATSTLLGTSPIKLNLNVTIIHTFLTNLYANIFFAPGLHTNQSISCLVAILLEGCQAGADWDFSWFMILALIAEWLRRQGVA